MAAGGARARWWRRWRCDLARRGELAGGSRGGACGARSRGRTLRLAELVPACRARSVHRTSSAPGYELVVGARRWPDGRWRPCAWASCVSAGRWRRPAAETRRSMHRQPVVTGSRAHRVAGVRQGRCPHAPGCGAHIRQVAAPTRARVRCPHAPGAAAADVGVGWPQAPTLRGRATPSLDALPARPISLPRSERPSVHRTCCRVPLSPQLLRRARNDATTSVGTAGAADGAAPCLACRSVRAPCRRGAHLGSGWTPPAT